MMNTHEATSFIIQQPAHLHILFQNPVGYTICLQMVTLGIIHWDEYVGGVGRQCARNNQKCN